MIKFNAGGVRVPHEERAQLWYRFQPFDGDTALEAGASTPWPASIFVAEMSVFESPAGVEMWFTVEIDDSPECYCVARAVATDIDSPFVIDDYYIGNGRGGTAAGAYFQGSYVWYDSGTYYAVATNGYGVFTGGTGKTSIFSTTNLASGFTNHGITIEQSDFLPATVTALGNCAVVLGTDNKPVLIGGVYYWLLEAFQTGFWRMYVGTSTTITGQITVSHLLSTAQPVSGAMYGGAWAMKIGSTIHMAYHYGSQVGDLPTLLAYATSTDNLATATIREAPFAFYNPYPYGSLTDQAADPWFVEIGGNSYLFYEICANFTVPGGFASYIVKKHFPGTLAQAFQDIRRS